MFLGKAGVVDVGVHGSGDKNAKETEGSEQESLKTHGVEARELRIFRRALRVREGIDESFVVMRLRNVLGTGSKFKKFHRTG